MQPVVEFLGTHGGAVIAVERSGEGTTLQSLRHTVDEILRGFTGVPLNMTGESGTIVEDAQRQWFDPLTLAAEDAA